MTRKPRQAAPPSHTVLVADPDDALRKLIRRWLEPRGFRVLDAGDASAAERIARLYVGPIHVLLVEMNLPPAGGRTLADRLLLVHPELQLLIACDRPATERIGESGSATQAPCIRKPFDRSRLLVKLRGVLGSPC